MFIALALSLLLPSLRQRALTTFQPIPYHRLAMSAVAATSKDLSDPRWERMATMMDRKLIPVVRLDGLSHILIIADIDTRLSFAFSHGV